MPTLDFKGKQFVYAYHLGGAVSDAGCRAEKVRAVAGGRRCDG